MAAVDVDADAPALSPRRCGRLSRWLDRGFWALADQGLFAGSNFAVNICLARWLPEASYGAFATAYACFLFLGVFHTALLTEPMLVFGSGRYRDRLEPYLGWLLRRHARFCVVAGLMLAAAGAAAQVGGHGLLAQALFALALTQPAQLLPWMLRDANYIGGHPRDSAAGGACYLLVIGVVLFTLARLDRLTIVTGILAMGTAALAASALFVWRLRVPIFGAIAAPPGAAADHWRYGRWAIATGLTHYIPQNLPLLLVPMILGYAAGGTLKALLNLTVPFVIAGWAFSTLVVPVLVARRNTREFGQVAAVAAGVLVVIAALAWLPVALFNRQTLDLIYDGRFSEEARLLWLIGLIPLLTGPTSIMAAALRALERPDRVFYAHLTASIVLVVVGLPLLTTIGLPGMIGGMVAGQVAQVLVIWLTSRNLLRAAVAPVPAAPPTCDAVAPIALAPLSARPLVSVIMANHNYSRFIDEAIRSVVGQTYDRWELVVCDDGSTDDSLARARAWAARDPRVRVVAKPNGGQASAWNAAMVHCSGEILCMLDSDDRFAPDKIARVVEQFARQPDSGLIIHPMTVIDRDGRAVQRIPFLSPLQRGWIAPQVIRRGGRWRFMPTSAIALRRAVADRLFPVPEQHYRTNADSFLFTLAPLMTCVDFIDAPLSDYRVHGANNFSARRLDVGATRRDIDSIVQAVRGANLWLASTGSSVRLRLEDHLNFIEQRFLLRALDGSEGSLLAALWGLWRAVWRDDLYSLKQKMLALPTYGLMTLLPRRWRSGWLTWCMSFNPFKRLFQRRGRPDAPAPVVTPPLASVEATA